ncbi:MAG: RhuM family protein [Terracidiphilus sp.]
MTANEQDPLQYEIILYATPEGNVRVEVLFESESFWLTQKKMAELFGVESHTITYHLKEIYKSGELKDLSTTRKIRVVQPEGGRGVARGILLYNLDAIIAVGYRVNSREATQFRIWATQVLREYLIKGFVLDNERLKQGKRFGKDYFDELLFSRQRFVDRSVRVALVTISLFVLLAGELHATSSALIQIAVLDKNGVEIASKDVDTSSVALDFNHEYQPGDHIVLRGSRRIAVRLDQNFSECLLYLPDSSRGQFEFMIPYGRAEQQTGSAYSPASFAGKTHRIEARAFTNRERNSYRNLALNPCDSVLPEDKPARAFPHSSTNSYARNLFDFAARNAIDGAEQNGHHGIWPYQSWGPEQRLDVWWKLDFGRLVELDKIGLMNRADFPHDSYWKSAEIEFSDGSRLPIQITSSASLQEFKFPKRKVTWFRIAKLVPADPAKWCSLIEVEAWGRDF